MLNQPVGVKFSITVPKFFTVEQLARQIEAEYAYLVEREIGHTRFPVIECGALFDHLEPEPKSEPDSKNRRSRQRAHNNKSTLSMPSQSQSQSQTQSPRPQSQQCQGPSTPSDKNPADVDDSNDGNDSNDSNDSIASNDSDGSIDNIDNIDNVKDNEHNSGDSDSEQDTFPDELDEQESRGVQLRFSDIVADVLDRDSTVHVVNIDQGKCIYMWHVQHSSCE